MKIVHNHRVVLNVNDEYIVIMAKSPVGVVDPTGVYWGLAQGYRVVRDLSTETLVLVPIGHPTKVPVAAFKPEDLEPDDNSKS